MHALILCEAFGAIRGQQGYIELSRLNRVDGTTSRRTEPMSAQNIGSAEIIAFPLRGRFAAASRQDDLMDPRAPARIAKAASGSAWYHEEAIRDERPKSN
jgi:hypothetical protein